MLVAVNMKNQSVFHDAVDPEVNDGVSRARLLYTRICTRRLGTYFWGWKTVIYTSVNYDSFFSCLCTAQCRLQPHFLIFCQGRMRTLQRCFAAYALSRHLMTREREHRLFSIFGCISIWARRCARSPQRAGPIAAAFAEPNSPGSPSIERVSELLVATAQKALAHLFYVQYT